MKLLLLLYCLCSLYLWTVNSQERVLGPDFLVIDGTNNLTLTCPLNVSSGQAYVWFTPGDNVNRCDKRQGDKVCIFIPRLEDDNENVTCQVSAPGVVVSIAYYHVNLKYPPQSSPNITVEPPQTELLKQGDVITCTVTGGKPSVTNITFECQHPDLDDREDDVSDDELTVSSSITVNTSRATEVNMTCTCNAFWAPQPGLYSYITNTSFQLEHPPQSSPNITIEPNQTEPLKQGDIITCTVSGGKPRVSNVTFDCQDPDHADREDDVSDDGLTVSSSITVNTSRATEVNMTCTCNAFWAPEPGLYSYITDASFRLEYKATVTNFTVNDTAKLTVNETSNSTVTFTCQGDGRRPPDLKLYKKGNDTALMETRSQPLVYTMNNVEGEDLATYTCEADNGFPVPNNRSVKLFVNSAPQMVESYDSSNPKTLSTEGLTFTLVAYPNPEYKESHFLGNMNVTTPVLAPKNTFTVQCTRNMTMEHLVNCHVSTQKLSKEKAGLYELTVSNGLGDASFRFRVESPVNTPQDDDSILTVAIVGAVAGFLLVIGIIVICVICHRRRKRKANCKGQSGSQNRNPNNGTAAPVTNNKRTSAALRDSRPDSTGTTTNNKINDGPSSAGGKTTAARYSTDSKGYASVGDTRRQGSNKAASTRRNNAPTTGYEDVELDQQGAPTVMTTPEKPDVVASIPEDSAEGIIGPQGDVYAVVAPKQKGNN